MNLNVLTICASAFLLIATVCTWVATASFARAALSFIRKCDAEARALERRT